MRQPEKTTGPIGTGQLRQSQTQAQELQRRISHLQTELRMKEHREMELQRELQDRLAALRSKNQQIEVLTNKSRIVVAQGGIRNEPVNMAISRLISTLTEMSRNGDTQPGRLEGEVETWILSLPEQSTLKRKLRSADESWLEGIYRKQINYLTKEAGSLMHQIGDLYKAQISSLRSQGLPVEEDPTISSLLGRQPVPSRFLRSLDSILRSQPRANQGADEPRIGSGYMGSRVGQVSAQDSTARALVSGLASQMRRLMSRYPKLATEVSPQLAGLLDRDILDVVGVDEWQRLVEIVKYKPEIVRVENVYTYSGDKHKKTQFHLRVLIKALLEEMEKVRIKTGVQPQIDERVIAMIREEIMDVVDVEDILRTYRVVPKIVEVEKIVEQVVEKIVPVPHFITVDRNTVEPVPVNSVAVVRDTVNVPLQVPRLQTLVQERMVVADQYEERVVPRTQLEQNAFETVTEIPSVRQIEKVIGLPHQVVNTVETPGPERIVPMEREVVKNLIQQKIVPVERVVERIVEVERIVQKVVPVYQEVPRIIQIQKIVEKVVPVREYVESQRVENYIVEKPVEVICYVEKIVPVERIVEKLVTCPEIVEKLVPVVSTQEIIKEVHLIREVPVYEKELVVQDRLVEVPLPALVQQVPQVVQQIVEVPFIHEKIKVETEYRKEPVIQKELQIIREPVRVEVPVVLYEHKVIELEKPVVQVLREEYAKQILVDRIIPVETVRDQLVPTPFIVEKIVEKMVEVPKVIEVERVVQKIVLVPRIVEKIVEVERIVEKIVEKHIYHTQIQPIDCVREVPLEVEKLITIQIPQYIIEACEVPRFIEKPLPIVSEVFSESVQIRDIEQPPRVVIERKETPIEIICEKVAPMVVQEHVYFELKQQVVVPMPVPVVTTLVEQKLVPVEHRVPVLQPVDCIREKVVQVFVEGPGQVQVQDRLVEKLFVENEVKVVRDEVPYYNESIKEVPVEVEKIVPVQRVYKQILEVPCMVEKLVNRLVEVPNIYEVEKIVQVPVRETELITVDRIVPKIITLNKAFAQIVDKLHEFPRLAQEMKQVEKRIDNLVVERRGSTQVTQTEVLVEKAVIQEKLKEVDRFINVVNESMKVVDRIVEKPTEPIIITQQKILEVPVIVEKLAERIVLMPQVVQVLKYVHQITEGQALGAPVSTSVGASEAQYQRLGRSVNRELASLRNILVDLQNEGRFRQRVAVIDSFLAEFNKFLAYPSIHEIISEKTSNGTLLRDERVRVQTHLEESDKKSIASAVLIDKLLHQLRRIKTAYPNVSLALDLQLLSAFGHDLQSLQSKHSTDSAQLLEEYSQALFNKLNSFGRLTPQHMKMLRQFVEERFELASRLKRAHKDAAKYRELYSGAAGKHSTITGGHEAIERQLSNYRAQVLKLETEVRIYREESSRLRSTQQAHNKCALTIQNLKQKITLLEEELARYKRGMASITSKQHLSGKTASGSMSPRNEAHYGTNYMEYVESREDRQSQASLNSDNGNGVYRSTGNYSGRQLRDGGSFNYLPQVSGQQLVDSRHSGTEQPRPQVRGVTRGQANDMAFSRQTSSQQLESSGGSSILYGQTSREIIKRTYRENQK